MVGVGGYSDCTTYKISVVVLPTIIGDPNLDYSELSAYLMYRLVPLSLDIIKEYQQGERAPFEPKPIDPEDPEEPKDYLYKAACLAYKLHIRRGPSGYYTSSGYLVSGQEVKVYNIENGWAAIDKEESEWVFVRYLKKIP